MLLINPTNHRNLSEKNQQELLRVIGGYLHLPSHQTESAGSYPGDEDPFGSMGDFESSEKRRDVYFKKEINDLLEHTREVRNAHTRHTGENSWQVMHQFVKNHCHTIEGR